MENIPEPKFIPSSCWQLGAMGYKGDLLLSQGLPACHLAHWGEKKKLELE